MPYRVLEVWKSDEGDLFMVESNDRVFATVSEADDYGEQMYSDWIVEDMAYLAKIAEEGE